MAIDWNFLIGKTIKSVKERKHSEYDNTYLDLEFIDGSKITIVGRYGMWTGESYDEYPTFVSIEEFGFEEDHN